MSPVKPKMCLQKLWLKDYMFSFTSVAYFMILFRIQEKVLKSMELSENRPKKRLILSGRTDSLYYQERDHFFGEKDDREDL